MDIVDIANDYAERELAERLNARVQYIHYLGRAWPTARTAEKRFR